MYAVYDGSGIMTAVATVAARIPALEALADAFCTADADWRVTYWNAAAERAFDTPREAVLGHALWEALPDTGETAVRSGVGDAMEGRGPVRLVYVRGGG